MTQRSEIVTLVPAHDPDPARLRATLASLLAQTMPVDICLIDDGSRQPLASPIAHARISILRLPQNRGVAAALHAGVDHSLAQGYLYIARLDVGDFAYPHRMAHQYAHMQAHPDLDLLGARARVIDPSGRPLYVFGLPGTKQVLRYLWKNPPFRHSSFFFRARAFHRVGNYDPRYGDAEDYEIMRRIARTGAIDCLPEILVDDLHSPDGLSVTRYRNQLRRRLEIQLAHAAPHAPRFYLGLARTGVLMLLPRPFTAALAGLLRR